MAPRPGKPGVGPAHPSGGHRAGTNSRSDLEARRPTLRRPPWACGGRWEARALPARSGRRGAWMVGSCTIMFNGVFEGCLKAIRRTWTAAASNWQGARAGVDANRCPRRGSAAERRSARRAQGPHGSFTAGGEPASLQAMRQLSLAPRPRRSRPAGRRPLSASAIASPITAPNLKPWPEKPASTQALPSARR